MKARDVLYLQLSSHRCTIIYVNRRQLNRRLHHCRPRSHSPQYQRYSRWFPQAFRPMISRASRARTWSFPVLATFKHFVSISSDDITRKQSAHVVLPIYASDLSRAGGQERSDGRVRTVLLSVSISLVNQSFTNPLT